MQRLFTNFHCKDTQAMKQHYPSLISTYTYAKVILQKQVVVVKNHLGRHHDHCLDTYKCTVYQ